MAKDDPPPTPHEQRAKLFAEIRHDEVQAKVRDEKGEFAVIASGPPPPVIDNPAADQVRADFFDLRLQLDTGLPVLLELRGVDKDTREAVRDYMGDVLKNLGRIEAAAVRMAEDRMAEARPTEREAER